MTDFSLTILAPGFAKWWGSDARALAQMLRRMGHNLIELDEEDFVSWRPQGFAHKAIRRLFGKVWIEDYNRTVLSQAESSSFDFVLVYKGNSLKKETVIRLREQGTPVYNFYPDVSFQDHGPYISTALQYYDCVFTTKSFHGDRERKQFHIKEFEYVRHGFDPDVHRPIQVSPNIAKHYECDVSFVGCWSPDKEGRLLTILRNRPEVLLRVYGLGWNHASDELKRKLGDNLRSGVFGDELCLVYRCSKVNLGLLSAARSDPTIRDQTTARTFQIPATESFMLHEDTVEVRKLFRADEEILLFRSDEELLAKLDYALQDSALRERMANLAYERCQRVRYDYSEAAQTIVEYFASRAVIANTQVRLSESVPSRGSGWIDQVHATPRS
jgi:spore maturation protein CgeB